MIGSGDDVFGSYRHLPRRAYEQKVPRSVIKWSAGIVLFELNKGGERQR